MIAKEYKSMFIIFKNYEYNLLLEKNYSMIQNITCYFLTQNFINIYSHGMFSKMNVKSEYHNKHKY